MIERENLTSEELENYHSLLSEAYPAPKTDIHAAVMNKIRAERLAQKKRAKRSAFVKWGSVAAVVAIACLIGFKVMPGADKFLPATMNDAAELSYAEDYSLSPCEADDAEKADGAYNGYSAVEEDVSGYVVGENAPGRIEVSDDSEVNSYGLSGGQTTPAHSASSELPEANASSETEETEETEEAVETVPVYSY